MVLTMLWLSYRNWIQESSGKHGISESPASRLGGVAIFIFTIVLLLVGEGLGTNEFDKQLFTFAWIADSGTGYEWVALLIALVGLYEDYSNRLSPVFRLGLLFCLGGLGLLLYPQLVPEEMLFSPLPISFSQPLLVSLALIIVLVGFINAGNMSDGANGLLASVAMCLLILLFLERGSPLIASLIICTSIFILFNVSTGLVFLGDFGSYGLSALLALGSFELFSSGDVSIWLLASFLSYPCIEMVRVIAYRFANGLSPFRADNNHLHNYLYQAMKTQGYSPLIANSITGLSIGSLFAVLPLTLYLLEVFDPRSSQWFWVFVLLAAIELLLGAILKTQSSKSLQPKTATL